MTKANGNSVSGSIACTATAIAISAIVASNTKLCMMLSMCCQIVLWREKWTRGAALDTITLYNEWSVSFTMFANSFCMPALHATPRHVNTQTLGSVTFSHFNVYTIYPT